MQATAEQGFTLIELIATVILLSIIGVVALSRLSGVGGFEAKVYFDDTVNAVRYAQKLAVSTGCNVQVTLTSATPSNYLVTQAATRGACLSGPYNTNVMSPVDRSPAYTRNAPDGVSITPAATFRFTPQMTTDLVANATFSIDGRQFRVHWDSGLVEVL